MLRHSCHYFHQQCRGHHSIRVGCASGFWGDTPWGPKQFLSGPQKEVDFLVFDYLSELTMSLLSAAKSKNPQLGFAPDFVSAGIGPYLGNIQRKGIKVISNAGGINTEACAQSIRDACKKEGLQLKVASVCGDNLMEQRSKLDTGAIREMFSGEPFPSKMTTMTAYFGAGPIVSALDEGADIVVTGRTADSALALAPFVHSFGWKDLDKLSLGSLAGHLLECGGQATGGLFTDWEDVHSYENLGFPIVSSDASGSSLLLSKPEGTGGILSPFAVAEQMLYEIGDPANYILPDVVCDFTGVSLASEEGGIRISGAKGKLPTSTYKVCGTYLDGFKGTVACLVSGRDSLFKGRRTAEAIMGRAASILKESGLPPFKRTHVQVLGGAEDALIWMSVHHSDKRAVELWSREIASAGTGMTPGLTGMIGGRPKAVPLLRLYSFLHPKDALPGVVTLDGTQEPMTYLPDVSSCDDSIREGRRTLAPESLPSGSYSYSLNDLAYGRSGDKGDSANIGLIARDPSYLPYIKKFVSESRVKEFFSLDSHVVCYDVPGIKGVNFVLRDSLGGGGMASLRPDPLGKAYAQKLLCLRIEGIPCLEEIRENFIKSSDK